MSTRPFFCAVLLLFNFARGEDYFLDEPAYNQTCQELHPELRGIFAEHAREFGGCRFACSHLEQKIPKEYLAVPNNIPCARNKACIQGSCHFLTDLTNCKSALNREAVIIKVASCRLKCSRDERLAVPPKRTFPVPVFHREGLQCKNAKFIGVCLDGKCVRQRTRSVQPRETINANRARRRTITPTLSNSEIYVKIDHYCRERYQDWRDSVIGKEVALSKGCQYVCEEPDVWESSETFKSPDDVPCDPSVSKVCNYGNCRHKEDVADCRAAFNTTEAVIVTRIQGFPCSLKCTRPLIKGWRTAHEKRRTGARCSNVYLRNGFCNKQGLCIKEPEY